MFRHAAWAVGSCNSGPPAARTVGTKSTGGFYRPDRSPCISVYDTYLASLCPKIYVPRLNSQKDTLPVGMQAGREPVEEVESRGVALLGAVRVHPPDALLDPTPNALRQPTSDAVLDQTLCQSEPEQVGDLGALSCLILTSIC